MSSKQKYDDRLLESARQLVSHIEAGEYDDADADLAELARFHETDMFKDLGRLTRDLHDTLSSFKMDSRIAGIAEHDIPDAKQRLTYVIDMTDQAAHRTLSAVEEAIPICEDLVTQSARLHDEWAKFIARDMTAEQFRSLVGDIKGFIEGASRKSSDIKAYLNEVMIAQDFQDLTGQTIRRVMQLVQDVEESLVGFFSMAGPKAVGRRNAAAAGAGALSGPQIPGNEEATAMKSQDEVDDLLSSLGF